MKLTILQEKNCDLKVRSCSSISQESIKRLSDAVEDYDVLSVVTQLMIAS